MRWWKSGGRTSSWRSNGGAVTGMRDALQQGRGPRASYMLIFPRPEPGREQSWGSSEVAAGMTSRQEG